MLNSILMVAVLSAGSVSGFATPQQTPAVKQDSKTHDGKVVSVSDSKLVMTDKDGKNEHTHAINGTAKILIGGKTAKVTDLQKGDVIKVTTSPEGVVTMVEATRSGT